MILLLGATGYLGQAFADELRRRRLEFIPLTRGAIDYTRFDTLFRYVRSAKPDLVINAAGYRGRPDFDACEIHRAEAVRANILLPQTVARVCYLTKTPLGHVSSGNIYAGAKLSRRGGVRIERDLSRREIRRLFDTQPHRFRGFDESDEPNFTFRSPPCSFYSGTKALAEEALRWFGLSYIWRPGIVFDECDDPRNFLSKLRQQPKTPDTVNSLSHRGDFVRACLDLWERAAPFGTYHVANPDAVTGRQLAEAIQHVLLPRPALEPGMSQPEPRRSGARVLASHCILDSSKLLNTGVALRPVQQAVKDALEHWRTPGPAQDWLRPLPPPAHRRNQARA